MNPNVEIITPELWAVNSEYIKAGWIENLTYLYPENPNPYASLTDNGVLIIRKETEFYDFLKKMLPRIMRYSDKTLQDFIDILSAKADKDEYEKALQNLVEWEQKRRRVKVEYLKHNKPLSLFEAIKKLLKGG